MRLDLIKVSPSEFARRQNETKRQQCAKIKKRKKKWRIMGIVSVNAEIMAIIFFLPTYLFIIYGGYVREFAYIYKYIWDALRREVGNETRLECGWIIYSANVLLLVWRCICALLLRHILLFITNYKRN